MARQGNNVCTGSRKVQSVLESDATTLAKLCPQPLTTLGGEDENETKLSILL